MSRGKRGMLLALLGVATAARAGDEGATKRIESFDGRISLAFPAGWQAAAVTAEDTALTVQCYPPNHDAQLFFEVCVLQGMRSALRQPWFERPTMVERHGASSTEVGAAPLPHLVVHYAYDDGTPRVRALAYRMIARSGYSVGVFCPAKDWPGLRDVLMEVAASLESKLDPWPPRPKEYECEDQGGFQWWTHPDVKSRDAAQVRKLVAGWAEDYVDFHGPLRSAPGNLPIVVLVPGREQLRALGDGADYARESAAGIGIDMLGGRLLLTAFDGKDDDARGRAAYNAAYLFHIDAYGYADPAWVAEGEAVVARESALVRRGLPYVSRDLRRDLDGLQVVPLRALAGIGDFTQLSTWREQCFAYVALFREGPKEYREAYAAFRAALRGTGDWEGEQERHLLGLDAVRLQEECARFVKRRIRAAR